jgi:AcrR family transcriptional regulator/DNA-binding MarR family transcriptional regulator
MSSSDDTQLSTIRSRLGVASSSYDEVEGIQRARILSAMVEVAAEQGYIGAAIAPVVARAGISRRTFYELFDGREDCFLAAFEWGVEQARQALIEAYGFQRSWRDRVRHGLAALLAFLDSEPELARLCVIEALGAGRLVLARRAQVLNELIAALDAVAPQARGASEKPLLTAEGVVGGAFSVLHGRLLACPRMGGQGASDTQHAPQRADGGPGPLIQLHGQLMALIALPYLGPRAAGEELTRKAPDIPAHEGLRVSGDPPSRAAAGGRLLERLDMRLTYRTVRCLLFIGQNPGSSNREIAQGTEIADEGQASKLLTRLTRIGLVANSKPHGPGYPNYWVLTPHGEQVLSAVRGRQRQIHR